MLCNMVRLEETRQYRVASGILDLQQQIFDFHILKSEFWLPLIAAVDPECSFRGELSQLLLLKEHHTVTSL